MKKTLLFHVIFSLGIFLSSCGVQVSSDSDTETDFSKFQTYKWIEPQSKGKAGKFNRAGRGERIVELNISPAFLQNELTKKGFSFDTSRADFLVRCKAFYEKEDNSANLDWTKPGNATRSPGWGSNTQNSSGIRMVPEKTTVVIFEILDPVSEDVLWRGVKTTVVGEILNLTEVLEKDVHLIVKKIPSRKKTKASK